MILHLKNTTDKKTADTMAAFYEAVTLASEGRTLLVTPSRFKTIDEKHTAFVEAIFVTETDMQLSSRSYRSETRTVKVGNLNTGGSTGNTLIAIGPCSVESEEQLEVTAQLIKKLGLNTLRAGAYKPRTSPYTFQGMGIEGLKLLAGIREKYGLAIITEVRDSTHADAVIEYADMIQVGAKSMYDHGILRKCGKTNKPILLKRGFGSTLQEFVQAAEFILSGGNENVILCERGIRTFETKTRFTLDLCGAAYLKEYTNLPVVLDPSHAMGYAYGVPDLACACMAMDVDGLLIEVHPNPSVALSDASQQLTHEQFTKLFERLNAIATALNKTII
ncbi:MAG: 3-deoxy-7-phosphoheptulonate synthase [Bacteroidota bacterium]